MTDEAMSILSKNNRKKELIRDYTEVLAYWEQRERIKPCEVNRFNIEYFKGFIEYIKSNLTEA